MIYRIFPQKDTFITNRARSNVAQTGSNFGASEVLHLFKKAPTSGVGGAAATASMSRILMQFDVNAVPELTASGLFAPAQVQYFLRLGDARHKKTLPYSYDIEVLPVSQSWDEGRGRDVDAMADRGYANWDKAKSNLLWTTPGGTTASFPASVFHVDEGHEDLFVEVTSIVESWLSGNFPNNGFMVKLSSSHEQDSEDYYVKMFFGREAFDPHRLPYLEARWDDSLRDNRTNFVFDYTGSLFLYNEVRGRAMDIPQVGTGSIYVKLIDVSGNTAFVVTGSHAGITGVYSASFAIPSGTYEGQVFYDAWFSGSRAFMTGTFCLTDDFAQMDVQPAQYYVTVTNLKNEYDRTEFPRLNLYVRQRDFNPAVVLTASSNFLGEVIDRAYYRIDNERTNEVVVPFGTGSVEYTRLSYDKRGNYFRFHMSTLPPGQVYRLMFMFDVGGQKQIIDEGFKFRVV